MLQKVSVILYEIGEKPMVKDCCRVGVKRGDTLCPIEFS